MPLLTRRSILTGLIAAPIVVTTPGLLMRVKAPILVPMLFRVSAWRPKGIAEIERIEFTVPGFDVPVIGSTLYVDCTDPLGPFAGEFEVDTAVPA